MVYTEQQLKDAYCIYTGTEVGDWVQIKAACQSELDARIAVHQGKIDAIPTDASEEMKRIALDYLAGQNQYQDWLDNADVNL